MWHSKEELLNFQRDGEIPCAPLGLIQSWRGGAIFVGGIGGEDPFSEKFLKFFRTRFRLLGEKNSAARSRGEEFRLP